MMDACSGDKICSKPLPMHRTYINNRHYIFIGILLLSFILCQLSLLHWLTQWIQDTLFNLFIIYVAWNVSYFIYSFDFVPKERLTNERNRSVLITGCDSGFGLYLAQNLCKRGYHIFAGCLSLDSDGARKLRKRFDQDRLQLIEMNVTLDDSVRQARKQIETILHQSHNLSLWALVNNAGIMCLSEIEFGDMSIFERQMQVNGLGVVRVTKQFLPLLRRNHFGGARVINMTSLAGRFTMPGFVGYCMSKAVAISFSDGLRREMAKWNIDVVSIEPHLYRTNLVNQQRLIAEFEAHWNHTEESIQKDYGRPYYDGFIRTMTMAMDTARTEIEQVVNTMEQAVTLSQVEYYYIVARVSERIRIWFWLTVAPVSLIDFFMRKFLTDNNGQPKLLSQKLERTRCKISQAKYE